MRFLWGAATSAHQIEGNNIHSDWWHWENQGNIETGESSGVATDHWNRFREDLKIAEELGLNSYRFSIEWSRLEPKEGEWDTSALLWYEELIAECERRGLMPMMTLHHFTSPKWFTDKGGFAWEHAPDKFAAFVKKVVHTLGPRVPLWCTLNEPMTMVVGQYLGLFMPPAEFQPELVSASCRNLLASHVKAYDIIHSEIKRRQGPWRHHPLMVGIAHNMVDFLPARHWHPVERLMTIIFRRFYNRAWLDAITGEKQHFGVTGVIPYAEQVVSALGRKTADFIGINYYTKAYLRWRAKGDAFEKSEILPMGVSFSEGADEITQMGWAIHPSGLGRMIRFVKTYGLPIYITENGIADPTDEKRARYLLLHLQEVAREIEMGTDLRGYFYWSLIDNFEWIKGFNPRFGLVEIDYKTLERKKRGSAEFYLKLIQAHHGKNLHPNFALIATLFKDLLP